MLPKRTLFGALLFGASVLVAGCTADLPTAPADDPVQMELLDAVAPVLLGTSDQQVDVLERLVPLESDEVARATVGPLGGVLNLPRAGLTVLIPMGALSAPTEIIVTAPAGDLVGYHFAPHGIEFERPVRMLQDMTKTKGLGLEGLSVVYFEGELQPSVTALERLALYLLRGLGVFRVEHFSGYVIATN